VWESWEIFAPHGRGQGGPGVAFRWRIRHKLILGLGLAVGVVILLLLGTANGVLEYRSAMNSIASKVLEENKVQLFQNAVNALSIDNRAASDDELDRLRRRMETAQRSLDEYRAQLDETVRKARDDTNGVEEKRWITALEERFARLDSTIQKERAPRATSDTTFSLLEREEIKKTIQELVVTAGDLHDTIFRRIGGVVDEVKHSYQKCLWIVGTTSICGILLMAGLLRFFYSWVHDPIRDLETGAERVAHGDFDHRIDVHSGDEMEDLAMAFNNMTSRLQEMYRDLAHQVNERSRQLVRSERLASVGFLAAGVAHEINNPLASIAFCSEALESRIAETVARNPQDGEVITKYLKMIQQEAFRCKAITQRLLEFSRSGERRREPTDLAELIQSVLDVVQHLQNSKGKRIIFEPSGQIEAWINAQEVKSVVLNLVVNALDSMDENGKLSITLRQRDRMAEMIFADSGCGMSGEVLENIFEPFFTRSRTGKGTGLGLSISHRVITQHGGEIEAASAGPNQGSTFTVRLPLQPAEEQTARKQGSAVPQDLEGNDQGQDPGTRQLSVPKRRAA
jgi:two-component system, NtrC family, sensor kinase